MPLLNRRMTPALIAFAALATITAACTQVEPPRTADLYEVFTGPRHDHWCDEGDEARLLENGADLMGPHFSISFLCHFTETGQSELLPDIPLLAEGTELLLNQIAHAHTYSSEVGPGPVNTWIEAGPERIDLAEPPMHGGHLAVVVPTGEDAVLWIEDEGRAQGLDLRTGEQIDPVAAYYNGLGLWTERTDAFRYVDLQFSSENDTWTMDCASNLAEITRSVWSDDFGWTPEGSALITIEFW
ncbi:hypothetical protein [Glycomyces buryatensis]|uniref:Uncharacterized protein n=1 Tax=Glycomyces buryatensis TaxID=2570927 RepID=A0A4S8QDT0_9ACTN|nr:hypothetical protein [Glycomyces buryatensis]THV41252.1 hypothetical protein FAB82_12550 [Glycomyces buryatensis]